MLTRSALALALTFSAGSATPSASVSDTKQFKALCADSRYYCVGYIMAVIDMTDLEAAGICPRRSFAYDEIRAYVPAFDADATPVSGILDAMRDLFAC